MKAGIALAAAVLAVSGCTASVTTTLDVTETAGRVTSYQVQLQGELAEAVRQDPVTDQGIFDILSRYGAGPPSREEDGGTLTYAVASRDGGFVPELTGAAGVAVSTAEGVTQATLSVQPPADLIAAVRGAAAGEPDAAALELTFLKSTFIEYIVVMPGQVTGVVSPFPYSTDGDTVRVRLPLDGAYEAEISLTSQESRSSPILLVGAALVVAGIAYGAYGFLAQRRKVSK